MCLHLTSFWYHLSLQSDLAYLQKKKEEEKALKDLKAKAQKGAIGGSGLKKSGKKW